MIQMGDKLNYLVGNFYRQSCHFPPMIRCQILINFAMYITLNIVVASGTTCDSLLEYALWCCVMYSSESGGIFPFLGTWFIRGREIFYQGKDGAYFCSSSDCKRDQIRLCRWSDKLGSRVFGKKARLPSDLRMGSHSNARESANCSRALAWIWWGWGLGARINDQRRRCRRRPP